VNRRRDSILREMGLAPLWRLRADEGEGEGEGEDLSSTATQALAISPADESPLPGAAELPPAQARAPATTRPVTEESGTADLDWEALEERIRSCTACRLCEQRKQAVPGVGDRHADWLLVGEGPGAEEDERGEPFVGQAGRLLDAMLAAIGLERGTNVYIANVVKCRPPHNRTPEPDETASCFPFLARQIELLRPRLIVALGRPAAQTLLGTEVKIGAARGRLFRHADIPLVVTYHPAYLLRNQHDKAKAWEDLCFARARMAELLSPG
jgi:DNA polymerase